MNLNALLARGIDTGIKADPRQHANSVWWDGIVMVIRADPVKMATLKKSMVHVMSACRLEYGGRRAIQTRLPYEMVSHLFQSDDGDAIEVFATLRGEHLQLHERASKAEFFLIPEKGSLVNAALQ